MNDGNLIAVLLLMLLSLSVAGAVAIVLLILHRRHRHLVRTGPALEGAFPAFHARPGVLHRPTTWLAIRHRHVHTVQSALGLHDPRPCTWMEGLEGGKRLFIAPPVNGWILVVGSELPDPGDDIDVCFRFLHGLSRKVGQVQFFNANRVLNHHAWVRIEAGRVMRAYAWAGRTLWNQGVRTRAELDLGLKCFQYFEIVDRAPFDQLDLITSNTEKVPLLAARWSLDPAAIDERILEQARGIAGGAA